MSEEIGWYLGEAPEVATGGVHDWDGPEHDECICMYIALDFVCREVKLIQKVTDQIENCALVSHQVKTIHQGDDYSGEDDHVREVADWFFARWDDEFVRPAPTESEAGPVPSESAE